ncbi:TetR/AcrR family transcriptional regulator [bacterium]|nr:TetR/AcrR family transcriptional regulator [bacterium]
MTIYLEETETNNKREITKSNNRKLIIDSGIKVFVEKGVAEATVRDIIRSTGLASGTFYNYFKSKEDVLVAIFDDFALDIGENIRSKKDIPKDFEEFLSTKITTFLTYVLNKPELHLIMSNNHNTVSNFSINTPQIILEIDYIKKEIKEGIKKGIFPEIDFNLFGLVLRPVADSIAHEMLKQKKPNVKKYTKKCVKFLINGLVETN